MNSQRQPRIGDIYYATLSGLASEQRGRRPCLVFSNNKGNLHSPNVIVLPVTSVLKKLYLPTHVLLPAKDSGLRTDSMVLAEQPVCLAKERLEDYISTLPAALLREVAVAHLLSTSAIAYINPSGLMDIWIKANDLNAA